MSAPLLRYALQIAQGTTSSLTYVTAGESAVLTAVVSNAGADVTLESLTFQLGPFGSDATDLAQNVDDVVPQLPPGWRVAAGTSFTATPIAGSAVVGTAPLSFIFAVQVNPTAGTSRLVITEVSSQGTAYPPAIDVTKMPASFVLAGLAASPALVEPQGSVQLTWTGTPGQLYTIAYPGGTDTAMPGSSGQAQWPSPAVASAFPVLSYTVSATVQTSTQILRASASTTVSVDIPQIVSFPQPAPCYAGPVALTWQTANATSCQLLAGGRVVQAHAPLQSPAGGYVIRPSQQSAPYQLLATKGATTATSPTVYVDYYDWQYQRTLAVPFSVVADGVALALSSDGNTLYYGGSGIAAIDTATMTVTAQTTAPRQSRTFGLALSADGTLLYAALSDRTVAFSTDDLMAQPTQILSVGGPMAMSIDGTTLYVAAVGNDFSVEVYALDLAFGTNVAIVLPNARDSVYSAVLSSDGGTFYVMVGPADRPSGAIVFAVDTTTVPMTATPIGRAGCSGSVGTYFAGIAVTPLGTRVFFPSASDTTAVEGLSIPGYAPVSSVSLTPAGANGSPGFGVQVALATDPAGGAYAIELQSAAASGKVAVGKNLFVIPPSGTPKVLYTPPGANPEPAGALLVNGAGDRMYFADQSVIVEFATGAPGLSR